jgi:hypothetical protein
MTTPAARRQTQCFLLVIKYVKDWDAIGDKVGEGGEKDAAER